MNGATQHDDFVPGIVRAFFRHEYSKVDPRLPKWLEVLAKLGAGECWHKKSSFLSHLFEVYKILKIWGQDDVVTKCGLFHSAYSNSYVNLAIFQEGTDRKQLEELVGPAAEALIHLFCVVPRHNLIYEQLLYRVSDDALVVPRDGIKVQHIKTGEPLLVDRYTLAQFLIMTMADFSEQLFSWQDTMFENANGKLEYAGNNPTVLWPGPMKPSLYHSALSRMGLLLRSCLDTEEEANSYGLTGHGQGTGAGAGRLPSILGRPAPAIPPIFNDCSALLKEGDQQRARDLYWEVVCNYTEAKDHDLALSKLQEACSLNPFVAEPRLLIAQIHMHRGDFDAALPEACPALKLLCDWGTPWDKRMSWEAYCAWARVIIHNAQERKWPNKPFGMLNLGLVPGLDKPFTVDANG